jgi:hypothetical protein
MGLVASKILIEQASIRDSPWMLQVDREKLSQAESVQASEDFVLGGATKSRDSWLDILQ